MAWTNPKTWIAETLASADLNTEVRDNLNFLKANIALGAFVELTIATGEVTKTQAVHTVDTQADAASDELDTINGGAEGEVLILIAENAARTVILKNGTGNLDIGGDVYLTDVDQPVVLVHDGTNWLLVSAPNLTVELTVNAFQYPAPGTDWTPALVGATLGASLATKKCWIPLNFLKTGDQIVSYRVTGDVVEAAAATLDCKLVRVNLADPPTTTDVAGGGITQVDADGDFDSEAVLTAVEVVATDKQYALEILGTTGAGDSINVMGAEVKVVRR
jgi:hypothetical protein